MSALDITLRGFHTVLVSPKRKQTFVEWSDGRTEWVSKPHRQSLDCRKEAQKWAATNPAGREFYTANRRRSRV